MCTSMELPHLETRLEQQVCRSNRSSALIISNQLLSLLVSCYHLLSTLISYSITSYHLPPPLISYFKLMDTSSSSITSKHSIARLVSPHLPISQLLSLSPSTIIAPIISYHRSSSYHLWNNGLINSSYHSLSRDILSCDLLSPPTTSYHLVLDMITTRTT